MDGQGAAGERGDGRGMDDASRWDAKYRGPEGEVERPPDPFVVACVKELGPGLGRRAVDLAAGTGRHALHLARAGFEVEAWDVSEVGLGLLAERARKAGLVVRTRRVDLARPEDPEPPEDLERPGDPERAGVFELACIVNFLHRGLLARVAGLVVPGGHVLLRASTRDAPGDRPPLRFRLEPGEIARAVPGFRALRVEEEGGRAGFLGVREFPEFPAQRRRAGGESGATSP